MRSYFFRVLDFYVDFIHKHEHRFDEEVDFHNAINNAYENQFRNERKDHELTEVAMSVQNRYLKKLKDEGLITVDDGKYLLTFEGKLFYFNTIWFFDRKPFQNRLFKERLNTAWRIAALSAAILNALAIIYLTYKQAFPTE